MSPGDHSNVRAFRPIERRVVSLVEQGVGTSEIAQRFRRSPEMIDRIVGMVAMPGRVGRQEAGDQPLRPLERRVLRWRREGAPYEEIGERFRRSARNVERVETLAQYKLNRS